MCFTEGLASFGFGFDSSLHAPSYCKINAVHNEGGSTLHKLPRMRLAVLLFQMPATCSAKHAVFCAMAGLKTGRPWTVAWLLCKEMASGK
jgi:hypothetical protein